MSDSSCERCGDKGARYYEDGYPGTDYQYLCSICQKELKDE